MQVKTELISSKESNNEIVLCQSDCHIQSNVDIVLCAYFCFFPVPCPELATRDRVIIQNIICNLSSSPSALNYFNNKGPSYRGKIQDKYIYGVLIHAVFLFEDADSLSQFAQAALRRTMETYIKNSRMFLHVTQLSRIISPLKSRCLCIRIGRHSLQEVCLGPGVA